MKFWKYQAEQTQGVCWLWHGLEYAFTQ